MKIKLIKDYYVFSVLKFYNGKLIDIIKFSESSQNTDFQKLKTEFQEEFSKVYNYYKTDNIIFGGTIKLSNLNKAVLDDVGNILDNSIESLIINSSFENKNVMSSILESLKDKYNFKNYPYKIECIDISHIGSDYISGGLSCLLAGIPSKKFYRMYKINTLESGKNDDYLSLKEVLQRRFKSNNNLPDLFIIDGGKGQLNVLKKLILENNKFKEIFNKVDFISIGKGKARDIGTKFSEEKEIVFYLDENLKIKQKTLTYDDIDKLLIKSRDEAHRFANKYRKIQMSKDWK